MSASIAQPDYIKRIHRCERELDVYRSDIQEWKQTHIELEKCWAWEDLVSKAIYLYDHVLEIDSDFQTLLAEDNKHYTSEMDDKIRRLAQEWLSLSRMVAIEPHHEIEDMSQLKLCIENMELILTPDDQFFEGDSIERMQQQAITDHRRGHTQSLESLLNEPA